MAESRLSWKEGKRGQNTNWCGWHLTMSLLIYWAKGDYRGAMSRRFNLTYSPTATPSDALCLHRVSPSETPHFSCVRDEQTDRQTGGASSGSRPGTQSPQWWQHILITATQCSWSCTQHQRPWKKAARGQKYGNFLFLPLFLKQQYYFAGLRSLTLHNHKSLQR